MKISIGSFRLRCPSLHQMLCLTSLGAVFGFLASPVLAQNQTGSSQTVQDFITKDTTDPFSASGGAGVTPGLFDIVHRAMQGGPSQEEFTTGQAESLDAATADFRTRQQQLLKNQQQTPPGAAATTP